MSSDAVDQILYDESGELLVGAFYELVIFDDCTLGERLL